jgi:Uma2 family endonuclease
MQQAIASPPDPQRRFTVSEYFAMDSASDQKHEYRDGQIIAMAGGTESHSLILTNLIRALGNRLANGPCRVYESNLRVRVKRSVRYAYPDVFVACDERQFDPDDPNHTTIINPKLIVEVLSPSTELSDRTEKFEFYLASPTLEEYVLVSQDRARVEAYHRRPDGGWLFSYLVGLDAIARLGSLEIELPLSEIYSKVALPKVEEP